jgi:hypothetical protein
VPGVAASLASISRQKAPRQIIVSFSGTHKPQSDRGADEGSSLSDFIRIERIDIDDFPYRPEQWPPLAASPLPRAKAGGSTR